MLDEQITESKERLILRLDQTEQLLLNQQLVLNRQQLVCTPVSFYS